MPPTYHRCRLSPTSSSTCHRYLNAFHFHVFTHRGPELYRLLPAANAPSFPVLPVIPLLGVTAPRRAAMLRDAGPGRHVLQPLVDDAGAHIGRRLADDADRPHLVDQQLPDFL